MTVYFGPNPNAIGNEIITAGLKLQLESRFYTGGSYWRDQSGNGYDFLINPSAYFSGTTPYMDFEGNYGMAKRVVGGSISDVPNFENATFLMVSEIKPISGDWRTLLRGGSNDHQVIIQAGTDNLGMYDNNGGAFIDSGFDITTVQNHTTSFNFYHWKFSQSDPYYTFGYNDVFNAGEITNSNATFNNGFFSIGGWHSFNTDPNVGSQFWGKIAAVFYYDRHLSNFEISQMYRTLKVFYNF